MQTPEQRAPTLRPGRGTFVGRERELALLAGCLAEARAGRAGVVLLAGEPGIGKTRLLEEFPAMAGAGQALTILRGGAIDDEGLPPYLPVLDALREYVALTPDDILRADLGDGAAVLARLLPELAARLGVDAMAETLGADHDRLRLFDTVASLVRAIAARGPLLVILDDLHWADAATCDLLVHLARRAGNAPLLVAGAYREGEADANPALARAIAELNRRRLLTILPLRRLGAQATGQLSASLLRGEVEPAFAALIQRHSDGNPFFVEELLRALVTDDLVVRRERGWALADDPGLLLPDSIVAAVRMRLGRLAPVAVELLETAAVIGRGWPVELLAAVAGRDDEQVEAELAPAVRARLIRPEPGGGYAFTHDKVRETLDAGISGARRRRLHLRVGEAIEARDDERAERRLAELAFHFTRAADRQRGAAYALAAGRQALAQHAWVEAASHFDAALSLAHADDDPLVRDALAGLAEAATLTGDFGLAADCYARLAAAAQRRGDVPGAARAWTGLGEVRWRQEAVADAREAFERALAALGGADSPDLAHTLLRLAELLSVSFGAFAESRQRAEQALGIVERLGDPALEVAATSVLGNIQARHGNTVHGHALLERALALALERGDLAQANRTCTYLTPVCSWVGEVERAWEVTHLQARLAAQLGDRFQWRYVYIWQGMIETARGNWAEAERLYAQAEEVVEQFDDPAARMMLRAMRSTNEYQLGRFESALATLRELVGRRAERVTRPNQAWALGLLARLLVEVREQDETWWCLDALEEFAAHAGAGNAERAVAYCGIVDGYIRLGEGKRAAAYYERLLPYQGQMPAMIMMADRALGLAAFGAGDVLLALRHLAAAEARERRLGLRPKLAVTLLYRGAIEQRLGGTHTADGQARVAEGLRLADELGTDRLARNILADLLPGTSPRPDGLSERQLEVLRLLAGGLTNREIANALSISPGTVANHITAIFTKTGVDNRAAAVAYAHRNGVVGRAGGGGRSPHTA